jgi:hypothetical protein
MICLGLTAKSQTRIDTLQIKETALNYIEGYYNADTLRMKKAIHPELAKRIAIKSEEGYIMIKNTGSSELVLATLKSKKAESKDAFKASINIYDISNNMATLKVTSNKLKFIDYLHMVKINNEWKILNVLWAFENKVPS